MKRFENKVVAITGGGSGMGKLSCEMFAAEGAKVCVVDINEKTAQATADGIIAAGGTAKAYAFDITDATAMEAFFKDVVDTFGRIDVYFTIAGISPVGTATTTSVEDFRKVVALDMESVFLGCKFSIPYMEKQGGGVILNLVGTYGIRPTPNKLGYSAAKAGALSITRSVAIDFARSNIRCNAICPGFVNTPLNNGFEGEARQRFLDTYQPAPFEIQAKDIAETALFLASDEARAITGQAIVVDGGTEASLYLNYKRASK
ncbi:SDR family NAD(P)-dependent oxidoreductase [Pseudoflavonifractor sp.]|jgi:NAD(P)-dependent dehydrogenase (short-subunit alcohol dehydrogenase family)|uniref:SDR family NAD(P)-dependent oxidoreductase n=1 Tax=Pseudoflavonifractor sp. TaxID=1980281 RepID=UPI003D93994B